MTRYYAFNGDADGLCALQQLHLVERQPMSLITGVKRDITLLRHIQGRTDDTVTVLDISLDKNREDALRLLDSGIRIRYFDHHRAGELPRHPHFESHIDESTAVCTSILVNRYIGGRYRAWAVAGAFGDNLAEPAKAMAFALGLSPTTTATLRKLGIYLNYNAYGETIEDLHCHPTELAEQMMPFSDPMHFIEQTEIYAKLDAGYEEDMAKARSVANGRENGLRIFVLPDEPWARRAIGVLSNELVQSHPDAPLAILSPKGSGGFTVSVRVPAESPLSAAEFCGEFETGGGRKSAGGINHLAEADLDRFTARFEAHFGTR
jgi:hypothetical protein